MSDEGCLVCALQGEGRPVVPGSAMDKVCSECQSPISIAPSGQKFLASHPDIKAICENCVPPVHRGSFGRPVPGAMKEAREFWRKRAELN